MQHLTACPACQGQNLVRFISCKDHTVSHETFHLDKCTDCGFVLTNPRPDSKDLPRYYQSDAYISHSDKSLSPISLLYRISRHFTVQWKYSLINKHSTTPPASILDFGCGTGTFLAECQRHGLRISGVEPSAIARDQASKNTNTKILTDPSQITEKFDAITLWHVLEHVPDFNESLRIFRSRLKDNGTMFVAVPNPESLDAKTYLTNWAGYDVPRHLSHFTRPTMERILTHNHLKLTATVPMKLDSFYVSLLSEKYKNANSNVINFPRALLNGWNSNRKARKTHEYSSLIYIIRK